MLRQVRLVNFTLLVIPLVAFVSFSAAFDAKAQTSETSVPLSDPTEEIAAYDLAGHFNLSIDDARTQMSRQSALIALSQRLAEQTDSTWAGARIDHTHGGALVVYTTDAAATSEALSLDGSEYSPLVQITRVDNAFNKLQATADEVRTELDKANVLTVGVIVDPSMNAVRVELPTASQLSEKKLSATTTYSTATSILKPYPDVQISYDGGALDPASCHTGYELCSPPLRGGIEIKSDNGHFCTGGLVVRSVTDYKLYLLTAGHCVDPNAGGSGLTSRWYTGFPDLSKHYIGSGWNYTPVNRPYWDAAILQIENPTGPSSWGLPVHSQVLVVESGGTRPTVRDETYSIDAVGDNCTGCGGHPIPQDSYLCWTGSTYQTDCGRFDGTSGNEGLLNIDNFGPCTGDSGGPVYASHVAYGIFVAYKKTTTINTTGWRYFSPNLTVGCAGYNAGKDAMYYQGLGTSLRALNVELVP
jgi:hypothetical protein